ncbi:MAG: septum formation initiator family protein [Treponema sp.]|uniref:septum formation initiator family protein n=1 Tax=Treponema sp. TaxID=166 RepID=UPI0025EA8467|nr:septum formation initiator family protein [Treponema sp.]MBQ8679549.1 septum formation initiator family protein [Treponema sp.]
MKRAKYLFTIISATLAYVLLSVTVGQNSIKCFNQMEEQRRIISKRTDDIQNINSELQLELTALQFDKAVIAAYARRLDYVSDDEKLVKITGLKPAQTALYDTGTVLRHEEPEFLPEKYCKMIGLFFGFLTFMVLFLYDLNSGNIVFDKNKKPIVTGVPVYDLPQI